MGQNNYADDVYAMLTLAGLVVRRAAQSLLDRSNNNWQNLGQDRIDTEAKAPPSLRNAIADIQSATLRKELGELANQLKSVHDLSSANLLNNWELGVLVQRIVGAAVGGRVLSRDSEQGRALLVEIQTALTADGHIAKLVSTVVDILQR